MCRTRLSPQLAAVCAEFAEHLHDEWAMIKVRTLYEYILALVTRVGYVSMSLLVDNVT